MEEEIEEIEEDIIEQGEGVTQSTACDHEYVFDGYNLDMVSYVCRKCPSGCQTNKNDFTLKKGKLCPTKPNK